MLGIIVQDDRSGNRCLKVCRQRPRLVVCLEWRSGAKTSGLGASCAVPGGASLDAGRNPCQADLVKEGLQRVGCAGTPGARAQTGAARWGWESTSRGTHLGRWVVHAVDCAERRFPTEKCVCGDASRALRTISLMWICVMQIGLKWRIAARLQFRRHINCIRIAASRVWIAEAHCKYSALGAEPVAVS